MIKTIRTLSEDHSVHLYYVNGSPEDSAMFNDHVELFAIKKPNTLRTKILSHSFFVYQYNFFISEVLKTENKYDYIWANDLPNLYPGYKLAKKLKAKLIFDSHEIFVETLNQYFPKERNWMHNLLLGTMKWSGNRVERQISPEVDEFVTVNDSLKNYFEERYQLKNPATVIMNLPNKIVREDLKAVDFRKEHGWSADSMILLFQGTLNQGRGLHLLLEAVNGISDDRIRLIVIGDGPLKKELDAFVLKEGLQDKIKMLGRIPSSDLPQYTIGADIGVNLLEEINLSKKFTTATKMFEYFQCGIPVLCSNTIENQNILARFEAGILTENSVENIKESTQKLLNSDQLTKYREACNKASEELNWESQRGIFDTIIK